MPTRANTWTVVSAAQLPVARSFTTYVPATSGTNVVRGPVEALSVARLAAGRR